MIPNGTAYESYPSFANTGSKTPPGGSTESAKYSLGMVPADTFPAEWANWLFHGATAGISRLNADVNSIKKELNSILAAYNITNDASAYDQLLSALSKIYPQVATCETAGATAAKSVAIQGDVLKPGLIYAVTFVHGNEYGDGTTTYPTFSINGGTAYPIKDNFGNYLKSGSWQDGETLEMLFTGSSFLTKYGISRATIEELKQTVPVGVILPYAGATAPEGWLICDGSAKSRDTYSNLFSLIGITYGNGDGITTFNLPDLRSKTTFGADSSNALGTTTTGKLPNIKGDMGFTAGSTPTSGAFVKLPGAGYGFADGGSTSTHYGIDASQSDNHYVNNQTYVEPANIRVNYIIKY